MLMYDKLTAEMTAALGRMLTVWELLCVRIVVALTAGRATAAEQLTDWIRRGQCRTAAHLSNAVDATGWIGMLPIELHGQIPWLSAGTVLQEPHREDNTEVWTLAGYAPRGADTLGAILLSGSEGRWVSMAALHGLVVIGLEPAPSPSKWLAFAVQAALFGAPATWDELRARVPDASGAEMIAVCMGLVQSGTVVGVGNGIGANVYSLAASVTWPGMSQDEAEPEGPAVCQVCESGGAHVAGPAQGGEGASDAVETLAHKLFDVWAKAPPKIGAKWDETIWANGFRACARDLIARRIAVPGLLPEGASDALRAKVEGLAAALDTERRTNTVAGAIGRDALDRLDRIRGVLRTGSVS